LQRFVVTQDDEELWSVRQDGADLYCYPTEDEARSAALALASQATEAGAAASVVIVPRRPEMTVDAAFKRSPFTGM
jgi:hypothetical protein